eukprot:2708213-Pyramimonas_sp.AAC.1
MADPTDAALGDGGASDSGITGATCDSDTPIDPRHVVTGDMDLSPDRRVVYRAEGVGWVTTCNAERRSADKYLLGGKGNQCKVPIQNMALRRPGGEDLNPGRGPMKRCR